MMARSWWSWLAVGVMGIVVGWVPAADGPEADGKSEEGFTGLFNGKDLTGWRYVGSQENLEGKTETTDKRFQVVNGIIVANPKDDKGKGGIRDLYTARNFDKPFHLKLQFRAG